MEPTSFSHWHEVVRADKLACVRSIDGASPTHTRGHAPRTVHSGKWSCRATLRDRQARDPRIATSVIEVEMGVEHHLDVVGRVTEFGKRVFQPGATSSRRRSRSRKCRGTCQAPCSRSPQSTGTRPSSCSMKTPPRIAMRMRLRSSAGIRRSQSGFGTTPNMAPPSRR